MDRDFSFDECHDIPEACPSCKEDLGSDPIRCEICERRVCEDCRTRLQFGEIALDICHACAKCGTCGAPAEFACPDGCSGVFCSVHIAATGACYQCAAAEVCK